jgi:hypothetical protein
MKNIIKRRKSINRGAEDFSKNDRVKGLLYSILTCSPCIDLSKSKPDEGDASLPMYFKRFLGHCSADACSSTNLFSLNEKLTKVIY